MKSTTTLNGVNTEDLVNTVNAIKSDPKLGQCKFRARNQWIEGGHNCATVKEFYAAGQEDTTRTKPFELKTDEPPVLLGVDRGANPCGILLSALPAA